MTEDRRPYIRGFDDCDGWQTVREWFKYDGMFDTVKRAIVDDKDLKNFFDSDAEEMKKEGLTENQIHRVLSIVEDEVRSKLWEYVEELEQSREKVDRYIDGLLDARQNITISVEQVPPEQTFTATVMGKNE